MQRTGIQIAFVHWDSDEQISFLKLRVTAALPDKKKARAF